MWGFLDQLHYYQLLKKNFAELVETELLDNLRINQSPNKSASILYVTTFLQIFEPKFCLCFACYMSHTTAAQQFNHPEMGEPGAKQDMTQNTVLAIFSVESSECVTNE